MSGNIWQAIALETLWRWKIKGKVFSVPTRKIYGVEVHLHSFLISAVDRGAVVSFIPQPLYPRYPLHRRQRGHQSGHDVLGRKDKYLAFPLLYDLLTYSMEQSPS